MKRRLLTACALILACALAPADSAADWDASVTAAFYAALGPSSTAENPSVWLEKRGGLLEESRRRGLDPGSVGQRAAELMLEWEWDLRLGATLQEADARLRQRFRVESADGSQGARRLAAVRNEERNQGGMNPPRGRRRGEESGSLGYRFGNSR